MDALQGNLKDEIMKIDKEVRDKIMDAALLLEANDHLAASAYALRERASNRHAAKIILVDLLGISEDDLENAYWEKGENHEIR